MGGSDNVEDERKQAVSFRFLVLPHHTPTNGHTRRLDPLSTPPTAPERMGPRDRANVQSHSLESYCNT